VFLSNPGLVPMVDRPDLWYLDGDLVWSDSAIRITIPAGFISDDASVPKWLDWIPFLDRQGLSRRPGLAHDGLYSLGRARGKDFADNMLREFCLAEGMTEWQAEIYFLAVHWFGDSSYAEDAHHGVVNPAEEGDFIALAMYQRFVAGGSSIFSAP
jgi:hypothetical protein